MRSGRTLRGLVVGTVVLGMMAIAPLSGFALDPGGTFSDDNGSIHEGAIEAIADVGITKGCNPPVNDQFCPGASVTREQMATFLVRALGLPAGSSSFTDLGGSVHAADIGALAQAGITQGCNPPVNDQFCPGASVTREQMATFLSRALGMPAIVAPPPLPDVSPSPDVVIGDQNWLYFAKTVDQTCLNDEVHARLVTEIEKTSQVVTASGREFVYAVAPNKAVVYPNTLPGYTGSCADRNSEMLRATLATAAHDNRVDLWAPFAAASSPIYYKHDTHWNDPGALLGSQLIAAQAAPGVWGEMDVVATPATRQGDLATIIGVDWEVSYDVLATKLVGVTPQVTVQPATIIGKPLITYSSPSRPELSSVRTLVIHDSFGIHFRNKLGPLFEELTFMATYSHPISDAARPFVVDSEQIVVEIVERNILRDFIGTGTAGHLAAALADDFVQATSTFLRDGDDVVFSIPAGAAGDLRYLIVELDVSQNVTLENVNEVEIPANQAAWPNELLVEASRYGFEIMVTGTQMRVPLPSSVTVTAAYVVIVE